MMSNSSFFASVLMIRLEIHEMCLHFIENILFLRDVSEKTLSTLAGKISSSKKSIYHNSWLSNFKPKRGVLGGGGA